MCTDTRGPGSFVGPRGAIDGQGINYRYEEVKISKDEK
jgi:hypothetical protein